MIFESTFTTPQQLSNQAIKTSSSVSPFKYSLEGCFCKSYVNIFSLSQSDSCTTSCLPDTCIFSLAITAKVRISSPESAKMHNEIFHSKKHNRVELHLEPNSRGKFAVIMTSMDIFACKNVTRAFVSSAN